MSTISAPEFLNYLRRSRILDEGSLCIALEQIQNEPGNEKWNDAEVISNALIQRGLMTKWQSRQLMKKRYKGFFLRQYKILAHLGTGGMSTVYLAEHTMMQRRVAIKVLPKKKLEKSIYLDRFIREAQAIASLDHPNIVRAYDIDQEKDVHYIVMEYFDGRNLQDVVETDVPLAYETAADYIRQAALALQYAHLAGVVHRDVKPGNLLVNKQGLVKVLDLGLALLDENIYEGKLTSIQEDKILGTADYLAPEQGIDSHQVDARADIYGLGGVLYYSLTGHAPFPDGSITQKLLKHQREEPESILNARPDVPDDLVAICQKMMSKKREDRQQSALEVVVDLQHWLIRHGFADETSFPSLETLQATPQTQGAVPITSQTERFKKLQQTGHWSLELENEPEESSIGLGSESILRLHDSNNDASSGMIPRFGKNSSTVSMDALPFSEETNLLTSSRSDAVEKDSLLLALSEIEHSSALSAATKTEANIAKDFFFTPTSIVKIAKPDETESEKPTNTFLPWYKHVPVWFWVIFGTSLFLSIFLTGVLVALFLRE